MRFTEFTNDETLILPTCRIAKKPVKSCFINRTRPSTIRKNLGDFKYPPRISIKNEDCIK